MLGFVVPTRLQRRRNLTSPSVSGSRLPALLSFPGCGRLEITAGRCSGSGERHLTGPLVSAIDLEAYIPRMSLSEERTLRRGLLPNPQYIHRPKRLPQGMMKTLGTNIYVVGSAGRQLYKGRATDSASLR